MLINNKCRIVSRIHSLYIILMVYLIVSQMISWYTCIFPDRMKENGKNGMMNKCSYLVPSCLEPNLDMKSRVHLSLVFVVFLFLRRWGSHAINFGCIEYGSNWSIRQWLGSLTRFPVDY